MIGKFLEISTEHISEKSAKNFEKSRPSFIHQYKYGFYIMMPKLESVVDFMRGLLPDDVVGLMKYAWENDIQMIILDGDAEIVNDLPVYEWK